jgi:hypothetical protein
MLLLKFPANIYIYTLFIVEEQYVVSSIDFTTFFVVKVTDSLAERSCIH